ncbi:ATP-grasp domain-containing protein [Legionella yabuuchiae]|uniref:ATP-grasp domain-containing protein n=1 Tax=Legionella yabuuchiae TaxID=376727 RepID=UPI0010561053|nr:ATP-grasp domain-containing protein [Legionella yabuuchiae]
MNNLIILFNPPFRNKVFPFHSHEVLKKFRSFILVNPLDLEAHHQLIKNPEIEQIIACDFKMETLISQCDTIINHYGPVFNIVYLAEECVQVCGLLRKHYGLSVNNLDRYIDKNLMVKTLKEAGLRVPLSRIFDEQYYQVNKENYIEELENQLSHFPLFIKPINLCGSVATTKVNNKKEFEKWVLQKANHTYLIQEYLEGTLFHCESFIKDGNILYSCVFEYSNPGYFFAQGYPIGSISLPTEDPMAQRVKEFAKVVLDNLGIFENGVAHVEIFLTQANELVFLEAAARPPGLEGDLLYQKHLDININETHFLLQAGDYHGDFSTTQIIYYAARYIFPIPDSGRIKKHCSKMELNSQFVERFRIEKDDIVLKSKDLFQVASTMVLWNKDYLKLREDFNKLKEFIAVDIE